MTGAKPTSRSPWLWIPSLYFAEGLPYALAMSVSVVLYKNLGVSNAATAFYTSWLYLPWVIKPLWSPVVDILKTRRQWIWAMQLLLGAVLAGVALTIPATAFLPMDAGVFLAAGVQLRHARHRGGRFLHAGDDRARAGVLHRHPQHVLPRGKDRRAGRTGHSRRKHRRSAPAVLHWPGQSAFALVAGIFLCWAFIIVSFCRDRRLTSPEARIRRKNFFGGIFQNVRGPFFRKPKIVALLLFLLLYRLGEAQLRENGPAFSARSARPAAGWP